MGKNNRFLLLLLLFKYDCVELPKFFCSFAQGGMSGGVTENSRARDTSSTNYAVSFISCHKVAMFPRKSFLLLLGK